MTEPLILARGLKKSYRRSAVLHGVDVEVREGETVALVGGSGAGKTTLAKILMRLIEPDAGEIFFEGRNLLSLRGSALRRARRGFQMAFQDPSSALNPRASIGRLLSDPLRAHGLVPRSERAAFVADLLERMGLPASFATRRPHELSGGQRQRVNIARALATRPRLLLLDEPVSALDAPVRAQILNLLMDVQRRDGLSYLLILHDLSVARAVADRIMVMEAGRIVESGPVEDVLSSPQAAATRALIAAIPRLPAFEDMKDAS